MNGAPVVPGKPSQFTCTGAGRRRAVVDALLLAETLQETGLAQHAQVAGDTRLAVPQHPADLPDSELSVAEEREQAQARRVGQALDGLDGPGDIHGQLVHIQHINISLYKLSPNRIKMTY